MKENKHNNEKEPQKWEIYYSVFLFFLFGLWVGFLFRGSKSWAVPTLLEHDFNINFAAILACLVVVFIIIHIIKSKK